MVHRVATSIQKGVKQTVTVIQMRRVHFAEGDWSLAIRASTRDLLALMAHAASG
jgi:hypothetical protein